MRKLRNLARAIRIGLEWLRTEESVEQAGYRLHPFATNVEPVFFPTTYSVRKLTPEREPVAELRAIRAHFE